MTNNYYNLNPKEDSQFFVDREKEEKDLLERISKCFNQNGKGCVVVSGSPGCGKSILVNFLNNRINDGEYDNDIGYRSIIVDLNYYAKTNFRGRDRSLTPHEYVSFFAAFEMKIRSIPHTSLEYPSNNGDINKNKQINKLVEDFQSTTRQGISNFQLKRNKWRDEDFDTLKRLIEDHLLPLCNNIKNKTVIFFDNIDFIAASDQHLFTEMFGKICIHCKNIVCVFTARPLSTALVSYTFRDVLTHNIGDIFPVKELNVETVINSRNVSNVWNLKDKLSDLSILSLQGLSCGNLEFSLKVAEKLDESPLIKITNKRDLFRFLYSIPGLMPFLFKKLKSRSVVPELFCVLHSLPNVKNIDDDYISKFNENCKKIWRPVQPTAHKEFVEYTEDDINSFLFDAVENYMIRRVTFDSKEAAEAIYDNKERMIGAHCSLTLRGLLFIENLATLSQISPSFADYS
ncbi:MAG: hypothetical protein ACPGVT_13250 [Maricaulaceae bacterium]